MDIQLIETGNGGDFVKTSKDLSIIFGFQNMIYLGLFGGNVEASSPTFRVESEQAFDFWGNSLVFKDNKSLQFNSETERILNNVALNSSGRLRIEDAVKKDLEFMSEFANVVVSVSLLGLDKVEISILVVKPDNVQDVSFIYIWDSTNRELIDASVNK